MATTKYENVTFSDSDVVDIDDWIPEGEYNPHRVRPFLLHDHGFVVAVSFGDCLQTAIDSAVDANKLDRFQISDEEFESDYDSVEERVSFLGNASERFDIETLQVIELPNPRRSFVAQFKDSQPC